MNDYQVYFLYPGEWEQTTGTLVFAENAEAAIQEALKEGGDKGLTGWIPIGAKVEVIKEEQSLSENADGLTRFTALGHRYQKFTYFSFQSNSCIESKCKLQFERKV